MNSQQELISSAMSRLFRDAHTFRNFSDKPVPTQLLEEIWDSVKLGPTAFNSCPLRITAIRQGESRQRLLRAMAPSNLAATQQAPLSLILSIDPQYPALMSKFDSQNRSVQYLENNSQMAEQTGHTSAWLQAGFLLLALRLYGLQVGPMTGANMAELDQEFHSENGWRSFMVINVGYPEGPVPTRAGRPDFTAAWLEI